MSTVLIIDDDPDFCYALSRVVNRLGHQALTSNSMDDGLAEAEQNQVDAVFLDVRLPDGNGLDLLPTLSQLPDCPEIIIITGAGDSDGAELAINEGAWDYIEKGTSTKNIALALKRALDYRHQRLSAAEGHRPVALRREPIIGNSTVINTCLDQVAQCAVSDINVLISGETGTGKDLFARAIHANSARADLPFVVVDCAALPESLVESILFGHRKGAYTGAENANQGLVLQAQKGTLFLDEIGELPLAAQKAFLRILQERRVRPVGAKDEIPCDFRLIAATNRDLEQMVAQGLFRKDLYFRIQSFCINLPSLKDRTIDIRPIVCHHANRMCKQLNIEQKGVSSGFFEILECYPWPGNIRELINIVEQAIVAARNEPILYPKHMPSKIRIQVKQAAFSTPQPAASLGQPNPRIESGLTTDASQPLPQLQHYRDKIWAQAEKQYLETLLTTTQGKIKKALQISGISQSRFYALLQKHGLRASKRQQ